MTMRNVNFTEILEKLNCIDLLRINPSWLCTPAFICRRSNGLNVIEDCGKGVDYTSAIMSAVFEAIERCSAETYTRDDFLNGTYHELQGNNQLLNLGKISKLGGGLCDKKLQWCKGLDMFTQQSIYVPTSLVGFPCASKDISSSTTGLAASTTKDSAVLHAILELIEHDTLSIYIHSMLPSYNIRLTECDGDLFVIHKNFLKSGIEMSLKFLCNDLNVPTVLALFEKVPQMPGIMVAGVGCHLDPRIATRRALTECSQSASYWYYKYLKNEMEESGIYHPVLKVNGKYSFKNKSITLSNIGNKSTGLVKTDLKKLITKLRGVDENLIVVDITNENFIWPAVRVIAPNLEDLLANNPKPGKRAIDAKNAVKQYLDEKAD